MNTIKRETERSFAKLLRRSAGRNAPELRKNLETAELLEKTRLRFPLGCHVVQSDASIESGRFETMRKRGQEVLGTVVGHPNEPDLIWVLCDGRKWKTSWHVSFWKLRSESGDVTLR